MKKLSVFFAITMLTTAAIAGGGQIGSATIDTVVCHVSSRSLGQEENVTIDLKRAKDKHLAASGSALESNGFYRISFYTRTSAFPTLVGGERVRYIPFDVSGLQVEKVMSEPGLLKHSVLTEKRTSAAGPISVSVEDVNVSCAK